MGRDNINLPHLLREIVLEGGACVDTDSDLFLSWDRVTQHAAMAVCQECAVRVECLEYARTIRPWTGIWGGVLFPEKRTKKSRSTN